MYEIGDALLFTLSAWRQCSWARYRRAFDDLHARYLATATVIAGEQDSAVRGNAARLLESLGHCDVIFGPDDDGICAAPSVLARLPVAGLPRAVLCGSRSPETLGALRRATTGSGPALKIAAERQAALDPFAPARIEVQARSERLMAQLANDVGVIYEDVPPAWSLASAAESVEAFLDSLTWVKQPDLTWPRTDFDPEQARLTGRQAVGPLILSRYQDPVRSFPRFWLWREDESAEVSDPSWGRYAVLAARHHGVLEYDAATGQLAVPAGVRLPRLIARAATLCSGFAPQVEHGQARSGRYHIYKRVPPDVYEALAGKLGQPGGEVS